MDPLKWPRGVESAWPSHGKLLPQQYALRAPEQKLLHESRKVTDVVLVVDVVVRVHVPVVVSQTVSPPDDTVDGATARNGLVHRKAWDVALQSPGACADAVLAHVAPAHCVLLGVLAQLCDEWVLRHTRVVLR